MNLIHQLASELLSHGHTIPVDVARDLIDAGYDLHDIENSIDGFSVIDPNDVDYFEYIDKNH
jgi:hypothetical protein